MGELISESKVITNPLAARPAPGAVPLGWYFLAEDTGELFQSLRGPVAGSRFWRLVSADQDMQGNTVGMETFPRAPGLATQNTTASGRLWLTYFTAYRSLTVTTAAMCSAGTPAGPTPTLVRYGLWTVNPADSSLTALVASTANDTSLFSVGGTFYPVALSSSFTFVPGQRYAAGVLIVSPAAMPTLQGASGVAGLFARAPRVAAFVGSLADLPATVAAGSLTDTGSAMWMGFY